MKKLILLMAATASLWSLDLNEALERALTASPTLKKAQSDINDARYGEMMSEAAFHPTLSVGFEWSEMDKTTPFGYTPAHNYNLGAKYNIFNGLSDYYTLRAQRHQSEASRLHYISKTSDLKLSVISAYTMYHKAQKAVSTQQKTLESLERSYRDTMTRFKQGMVAKNELLLIDVDRLRAEQAVVVAKSNVRRSRSNLNLVMGGSLGSSDKIEGIENSFKQPPSLQVLRKSMYENRSELKAMMKTRESFDERYKASKSTYMPTVDVGANYIAYDRELDVPGVGVMQHKENYQVIVSANWDLYSGGANEAYRLQELEQVSRQDSDIEALKLDLEHQLNEAYEDYLTLKSELNVAIRAKESAEENYRITKDRYDFGDVDTLTLLTTQSNLTAARNAYYDSHYDLYTALAALERISGE